MPRDNSVYLQHILDAIAKVERYIQDVGYEEFLDDSLIQDGVIRQTEIVGEAVRRLSRDLRAKYPHIPWQDIAGMRDKLIHDYFGVDLETVWLTALQDLPELKAEILQILRDLG